MSTFKRFQKLFINDADIPESVIRVINQLQGNIGDSITPLNAKTQNDSLILTNISLVAGQINTIGHGLAQPLSGWKIIDINADANVWRVNNTSNTSTFLYLQCSTNCIVSIEVF